MHPNDTALSQDSMRILFVCDGNICRSPMAEALLRTAMAERRIDWIEVTSAGLVASQYGVAHQQLRRVLGPSFALVENRRSVPMTEELVAGADLILGMESRHVRQIHERFPWARGKVDLVTTYAGREGEIRDFPDSGYGDVVSWLRHCHSIMVPSVDIIADRLLRENGSPQKKID